MTKDGETGERWEKSHRTTIQPDGAWHDLVVYGHDDAGTRAFLLPDWLIDRILADHERAQRVGKLEAALRYYGRHKELCPAIWGFNGTYQRECDCGFAEALALLAEVKGSGS